MTQQFAPINHAAMSIADYTSPHPVRTTITRASSRSLSSTFQNGIHSRSAVTPSPKFQKEFQNSKTNATNSVPQSKSPDSEQEPEIILRKYIQNHQTLGEFDEDTAFEICQGAAALCFMSDGVQVGIGSDIDSTSGDLSYADNGRVGNKRKRTDSFTGVADSNFRAVTNDGPLFPILPSLFSSSSSSRKKSRRNPTRLALSADRGNVNSLHAFVRSDLLEIFTVPSAGADADADADEASSSHRSTTRSHGTNTTISSGNKNGCGKDISSSTRLFPGRVGLRCTFCSDVPQTDQHTMSSFHPKRLADLYRSGECTYAFEHNHNIVLCKPCSHLTPLIVCTWQRVHFQECGFVSEKMRKTYRYLKESDKTRGKTAYWISSAKAIGLEDVKGCNGKGGISFQRRERA